MRFPLRLLTLLLVALPAMTPAQDVTLAALIDQAADLTRHTSAPDPAYLCLQASSYDRASTPPPGSPGWYDNTDFGQFIRTEQNGGRTEYVLMDESGPGCILRIWSANPQGTLRFYLDGSATPALEVPMADLLSGAGPAPFKDPFAYISALGYNCYFPIPYNSGCKVTADDNSGMGLFYHVGFRRYEAGTTVETFSLAAAQALQAQADTEAAILDAPDTAYSHNPADPSLTGRLTVGGAALEYGPAAAGRIRRLLLHPLDPSTETLRHTLLEIDFDGQTCVQAPLGDFFGSGPGLNSYQSLPFSVGADGSLVCRWPMPFQDRFTLRLLGDTAAEVDYQIDIEPQAWPADGYYFHAWWSKDHVPQPGGYRDWRYVGLTGEGRYVGNVLNVTNPFRNWWGEGDEKIYLDGSSFPDIFGTGSEDYYGYAWLNTIVYDRPFHAQTRAGHLVNYGRASVNRWHVLDDLAFNSSLVFDMERLQIATGDKSVLYDVVNYWYAPAATSHDRHVLSPADLTLPEVPPFLEKPMPGLVVEGEDMTFVSGPGDWIAQLMEVYETADRLWSNHEQGFYFNAAENDTIELDFTLPTGGEYRVLGYFTRAPDYGRFQLYLNGIGAGFVQDLYAEQVEPTEAVNLGVFNLEAGAHRLRIENQGKNDAALPGYVFGLDALAFVQPEDRDLPQPLIEGENLPIQESDGPAFLQNMSLFEDETQLWSRHAQLFWLPEASGATLRLRLTPPQSGRYDLRLYPTAAPDYGIFDMTLNGEKRIEALDLYSSRVEPLDAYLLENILLEADNELAFHWIGANAAALGGGLHFGLDAISLTQGNTAAGDYTLYR